MKDLPNKDFDASPSFLSTYKKAHIKITDADEEYAETLGLVAISLLMRNVRTVGITGHPDGWRHNLFIILLGPPGAGRSTAIWEIFKPIVRRVPQTTGMGSPEAFFEELSEFFELTAQETEDQPRNATAISIVDEANKLFRRTANPRSYMSGILEDLSRLWDCPELMDRRVGTRKKGKTFRIQSPYLSLVMSAQTKPFVEIITPTMLEQGLFCRLMPCVSNHTTERDLEILSHDYLTEREILASIVTFFLKDYGDEEFLITFDKKTLSHLNKRAKQIRELGTELGVPQVATRFADNFVRVSGVYLFNDTVLKRFYKYEQEDPKKDVTLNTNVTSVTDVTDVTDNVVSEDTEREGEMTRATRVTPVTTVTPVPPIQISKGVYKLKMETTHLEQGFTFIQKRLEETATLYADVERHAIVKRILGVLRSNSPRERRDLFRCSHLLKKDFEEGIETLQEAGEVCSLFLKDDKTPYFHLKDCKSCGVEPYLCIGGVDVFAEQVSELKPQLFALIEKHNSEKGAPWKKLEEEMEIDPKLFHNVMMHLLKRGDVYESFPAHFKIRNKGDPKWL